MWAHQRTNTYKPKTISTNIGSHPKGYEMEGRYIKSIIYLQTLIALDERLKNVYSFSTPLAVLHVFCHHSPSKYWKWSTPSPNVKHSELSKITRAPQLKSQISQLQFKTLIFPPKPRFGMWNWDFQLPLKAAEVFYFFANEERDIIKWFNPTANTRDWFQWKTVHSQSTSNCRGIRF